MLHASENVSQLYLWHLYVSSAVNAIRSDAVTLILCNFQNSWPIHLFGCIYGVIISPALDEN